MDQKKQMGFSLFPQPPTPPSRPRRTKKRSISNGSNKLIKPRTTSHGRKSSISESVSSQYSAGLMPGPLKIRRSNEGIPPLPTNLPPPTPSTPSTPSRGRRGSLPTPKTPEQPRTPIHTSFQSSRPLSKSYEANTPAKPKPRAVSDFVDLESRGRKRASTRLSQWLDLEDGEIDRKRLSMYLGSVLDNTFEVPIFEDVPLPPIIPNSRPVIVRGETTRPPTSSRCECPANVIICHCSSSPDFERFKSWTHHKISSSISSTACLLGVPRARFQSAFYGTHEPAMNEYTSPPGLYYDTEDASEVGDWSSPLTPSKDDVFSSPRTKSYSSKCAVSTSSSYLLGQSRIQSFSRPFRPDSTYRNKNSIDSTPSTPSRNGGHGKGVKFLKSISTMSSFDFDFNIESANQTSLPVQEQAREQQERQILFELPADAQGNGREASSHLRTESNESFASQAEYELSTATATMAMAGSNIKPVLVDNTIRRTKTPHSASTSTSSAKSSSAQSWCTANETLGNGRSRSGTTATTGSASLSALLHLPLIMPNQKRAVTSANSVDTNMNSSNTNETPNGNAFARSKSNPIPSQVNEGHQQVHLAARANTTAGVSSFSTIPALPTPIITTSPCNELNLLPLTAAGTTAAAFAASRRHKSSKRTTSISQTLPRHTNDFLFVDDRARQGDNDDYRHRHRDDSGIFGIHGIVPTSAPVSNSVVHTTDNDGIAKTYSEKKMTTSSTDSQSTHSRHQHRAELAANDVASSSHMRLYRHAANENGIDGRGVLA